MSHNNISKLTKDHKPTYNRCGFSLEKLNYLSEAFGFNTLPVLGYNVVFAAGIDVRCLDVLKGRCT